MNKDFKTIGEYMNRMVTQLKANPDEHGFLGTSNWLGTTMSSNNTSLQVMYFRSSSYVHKFAHSSLHRDAWTWFNATSAKKANIGIFHELYQVPRGNWETIYANMKPELMAGAQIRVEEKGQGEKWVYPVVDAGRGKLKTSKGRMSWTEGDENDKYGYGDAFAA